MAWLIPDFRKRTKQIKELFNRHVMHILKNKKINVADILKNNLERALELSIEFHRKMGALDGNYSIKNKPIVEYNSNRIQHFLKKYYLK